MKIWFIVFALFFLPAMGFAQDTWYVDDDNTFGPWLGTQDFPFRYIGIDPDLATDGGIERAVNGDTVIVMPGTYYENLDFFGKEITVKSDPAGPGAPATIVDGMQLDSVVKFISGETTVAVLDGFTLLNGSANHGGGVLCNASHPSILNNIIGDSLIPNVVVYGGGGIDCYQSSPVIDGNEIAYNTANGTSTYQGGGGIRCYHSSHPQITNNQIHENTSNNDNGGGIYIYYYCNPTIAGNTIYMNNTLSGGGIFCRDHSNPVITDNYILNNIAAHDGGGIDCYGTSPTIARNIICFNEAVGGSYGGGGIRCYAASPEMTNNVICYNSAPDNQGGGIHFYYYSSPLMVNNTICHNTAKWGGGIYLKDHSSPTITNGIHWGNIATDSEDEIYIYSTSSQPQITYCCVKGGWPGEGNLSGGDYDDPLFIDTVPPTVDYRLEKESTCINRGTHDGAPADDLEGTARPDMGSVDMGAYEYTGPYSLSSNSFTIPQASGGIVNFYLDAGPSYAGVYYCVFGSKSGTGPGILLPGLKILPLNWDTFTQMVIDRINTPIFPDTLGLLNGSGLGSANLNLAPGQIPLGWVGQKMYFAFTVASFDFASNPVEVEIL